MKPSDLDILIGALTIDGEARGESQEGRVAVAHSILNRCAARKWWGQKVSGYPDHSIAAVCLKPMQYSCWNTGDPNSVRLRNLRIMYREAIQDKGCRASLKALIDAMDGFEPDQTLGSTHYLTMRLHESGKAPAWSKDADWIQIGKHRFFKGIN